MFASLGNSLGNNAAYEAGGICDASLGHDDDATHLRPAWQHAFDDVTPDAAPDDAFARCAANRSARHLLDGSEGHAPMASRRSSGSSATCTKTFLSGETSVKYRCVPPSK